jgi:hypothetical protein
MTKQTTVRQTYVLPTALVEKVDEIAAQSKRSRNGMVEVLLEQALRERERRFAKLHSVLKKIDAAPTDEDAARYDEELTEAIFGRQERKSKRA